MAPVEVFADISCPFTHVGLRRLREARRRSGTRDAVRIRAWPLELINGEPLGAELVGHEAAALRSSVAPTLFEGLDTTKFPFTSIPAFGLAAAGYALDDATGEDVSLAIRNALFEQGLDVADRDVLCAIGEQFGVEPLDPAGAESAVRADWARGKLRGVQGSPHFFVGERGWFCPSLEISGNGERFDIDIADETMRDFYGAALGDESIVKGSS